VTDALNRPGHRSSTWNLTLSNEEIAVIEHALAHISGDEISARLGWDSSAANSLLVCLRGKTDRASAALDCAPVVALDEASLAVNISGEQVACKPTSFRLLAYLIERRGRWVQSETLGRDVIQSAFQRSASNLRWHVLQARRALGRRGPSLHSDNRLGFMFDLAPCGRRHCAV
jgi:DNA-binding response OmpR family regulator